MLRAAQSLAKAVIDAETLTSSGLTAKQARRFLAMSS
jgi:DNA processing protein